MKNYQLLDLWLQWVADELKFGTATAAIDTLFERAVNDYHGMYELHSFSY